MFCANVGAAIAGSAEPQFFDGEDLASGVGVLQFDKVNIAEPKLSLGEGIPRGGSNASVQRRIRGHPEHETVSQRLVS